VSETMTLTVLGHGMGILMEGRLLAYAVMVPVADG